MSVTTRVLCTGILVLLGVGTATPIARAGDGVVEINAARALAGGVTPNDGPGYPVLIDVPGSYRLTSDLAVSATGENDAVAIEIVASDVTLDLAGFRIDVSAEFPGAGRPVTAQSENVRVIGGTFSASGGFNGAGLGPLGVFERIRTKNVSLLIGEHGVIRECSLSDADATLLRGLAISNKVDRESSFAVLETYDALVLDNHVTAAGNTFGALIITRSLVIGNTVRGPETTTGLATRSDSYAAYGRNVINGDPPVGGNGTAFELGTNVCGEDTTCP